MNNFKVGDLINTNLTNSIVIGVYGNDAILYSKSDYIEQYVYAHNIEYDEKANLEGSGFICCDLNNANLNKAKMENTVFKYSDLNNANLYKTWLVNATFLNVNMENANVEEAVTEAITLDNNYSPSKKDKFYMKNCNYKNTLFEYVYDKKESLLEKAPITSKSKEYER